MGQFLTSGNGLKVLVGVLKYQLGQEETTIDFNKNMYSEIPLESKLHHSPEYSELIELLKLNSKVKLANKGVILTAKELSLFTALKKKYLMKYPRNVSETENDS